LKKLLTILSLFLLFVVVGVKAQSVYTITADSTKLIGCDSNELIIMNHTQNVPGFLFNSGNGRTVFQRGALRLSDSLYLIGADTIITTPTAWIQGGNSFGATGILGTLDNNHLDLYTNNTQRLRITNTGNVLMGSGTDNGENVQINGNLFVADSCYLSGMTLASNGNNSTIRGGLGRSLLIGQPGTLNTGFYNNGTGSVIIHAPLNSLGGIGGTIINSVIIGGNSCACSDSMSNSLVIAKDIGYDQVYNSSLMRSNILALGGSTGLLRDDNAGGASYILGNYAGNIYIGYNTPNWATNALPSNYIQIGGSQHNYLGLFGGFHATPPTQSTLAGPSFADQEVNTGFPGGSYFRVAAGAGEGSGIGADLRLSVAPPGSSGSQTNPFVDAICIAAATANIGIGTTSPTAQLHTTGSVRFAGLTQDSTQTQVLVTDVNGNVYYRSASSLATDGPVRSALAVNGTIRSKKIIVSPDEWADYVFDSTYRLPNLAEVESYIHREHCLPGIPSAAAVQKDSLDVGAGQAALLKKIEELTLYTIDQNKKLNEQTKRLEAQDQQLASLIKEVEELKTLVTQKK
jgi:hypothetical protein